MERKLHLLESFVAQGSDGVRYKVCGYEHLVRDESIQDAGDHWEPTGVAEYRTADGAAVGPGADGSMYVVHSGVVLRPQAVASAAR